MDIIVLDTETTSLASPEAAPLDQQPYIIELTAAKLVLDEENNELIDSTKRLSFLVKPPIPIPKESTLITGITEDMVKGAQPFPRHWYTLAKFFLGAECLVAHNLYFDLSVLSFEMQRIGKLTAFPWPPVQTCTVERTVHMRGFRLNLSQLHEIATGVPHTEAHRSGPDVEALVRVAKWCHQEGLLW